MQFVFVASQKTQISSYIYIGDRISARSASFHEVTVLVELPRDKNKANLNKLRLIAKFGMIVYYKIVINNLI